MTNYAHEEVGIQAMVDGDMDFLMNNYSRFLHDGDFEKYQFETNDPKEIRPDRKDVEELMRYLWINNRYTIYGSKRWSIYSKAFALADDILTHCEEHDRGQIE